MHKQKIDAMSPEDRLPYTHLEPIVDALIRAGNEVSGPEKFYMDRDGWRCDLKRPIDFPLLQERFDLPSSILLSESFDSILCQNSWIEIEGSVPHSRQKPSPRW
jgi:hypothetical protein